MHIGHIVRVSHTHTMLCITCNLLRPIYAHPLQLFLPHTLSVTRTHTHTHTHTHVLADSCAYSSMQTHVRACVRACVRVCVGEESQQKSTSVQAGQRGRAEGCVRVCVFVCVCVCVCVCVPAKSMLSCTEVRSLCDLVSWLCWYLAASSVFARLMSEACKALGR